MELIENALRHALQSTLQSGGRKSPKNLSDSIGYSLYAPGKRIRPRLALACGNMLGVPEAASLAAGVAIEMIHCFSLIHDDLPAMDNDDFRRGKPSNHKVYGEAVALLAGDALMPIAFETLAKASSVVSANHVLSALLRLTSSIGPLGMVGGQAEELEIGHTPSLDALIHLHAGKTGALFSASLLMPKDLAGVSDASPEGRAILNFSEQLGLAFQIADDLDDSKQDLKHPTAINKNIPPTSVLHYLSPKDASDLAASRLRDATATLEKVFGQKSATLSAIATEVQKSLVAPLTGLGL
jgi:geranylgeranyl diphosphate synthase type II